MKTTSSSSQPRGKQPHESSRHPADGLTGRGELHSSRQSGAVELASPIGAKICHHPIWRIFECMRRLVAVWPDIAARRIEGEQVFSGDPGLWKRAMTEWPMGGFARMAADFMIEQRPSRRPRDRARSRRRKLQRPSCRPCHRPICSHRPAAISAQASEDRRNGRALRFQRTGPMARARHDFLSQCAALRQRQDGDARPSVRHAA